MMKTKLMSLSCVLVAACSGNAAVDLGGDDTTENGWSDTKTTTASSSGKPWTLYGGHEIVRAIAVDETTVAASIEDPATNDVRLELCQLADCQGTLQTIWELPHDSSQHQGGLAFPGSVRDLIISQGEVIWSAGYSAGPLNVMACSVTGCPEGVRQITVGAATSIVANEDYVFWLEQENGSGVARCPRSGCDRSELQPFSDAIVELFFGGGGAFYLALDEDSNTLYASGGAGIARMPADFSSELTTFHESAMGVQGIAIVGPSIYYAVETLTGQIRKCPLAGCEEGSVLVVDAPRWPFGLIADRQSVYWTHQVSDNVIEDVHSGDFAVVGYPLDASSAPQEVAVSSEPLGAAVRRGDACGLVMNSHHLYWCESSDLDAFGYASTIRSIDR